MFFVAHPLVVKAKSPSALPDGSHNFDTLGPMADTEVGPADFDGDWLAPTNRTGFPPSSRMISRHTPNRARPGETKCRAIPAGLWSAFAAPRRFES